MLVFDLALKSLRNRAFSTSLTVGSIALSVALLIGVENVRAGMRESFSNTISQTDLIVGTKGGTIQLLLYSVFGMGAPTENVSWEAYREWADHPAVEWTIPYSLGDSHRGFRVIGTNEDFFRHYRYRGGQEIALAEGRANEGLFDVTLGADVAAELNYALGDEIAVTHGLGEVGFINHDHMPFTVTGVLAKTFTPVDRAIYVTLEGMEAIHWEDGAPPASDDEHDHEAEAQATPADDGHAHDEAEAQAAPADDGHAHDDEADAQAAPADDGHAHDEADAQAAPADDGHAHTEDVSIEDVEVTQVTSFFVGTTNRRDVLQLQREINDFEDEPMMAVIPGAALNEMWQGLAYAETGLRLVAIFVVLVGLLGMLVSLYTSLNERRREMAILRAVGAGPNRIIALLVLESLCLASAGALAGLTLVYALLSVAQPLVEAQAGLFIPIRPPGSIELLFLGAVVTAGFLMGFVPALKAYRTALHDGLAVRV
ncbi:ABC transporter permease [Candidatus Palauibacter polyketidifaciens]|uniref:ABC transporter permease n=1 Tax=Candidatus Palauibacter polyketidifaciens TaxID=3056740 RepID=UPI0023908A35|nr:ABC transporter permease [Candidatus Palauibacter polyketidifaciens]MDE2720227.1 ABC transporter permease [Candidatus Palauibacter polyketidifaciens]